MSSELILLVDDEPSIIQLSRMYFEREGFRVHEVGDGEAALEAAVKLRPALIVLDIMLPDMSGRAVLEKLRERGLNQSQMADELGISASYLNHLERNQRPVTAGILLRLAEPSTP